MTYVIKSRLVPDLRLKFLDGPRDEILDAGAGRRDVRRFSGEAFVNGHTRRGDDARTFVRSPESRTRARGLTSEQRRRARTDAYGQISVENFIVRRGDRDVYRSIRLASEDFHASETSYDRFQILTVGRRRPVPAFGNRSTRRGDDART